MSTAKKATKKTARKASSKASKSNATSRVGAKRLVFEDGQKIKVVSEHNRREGSRYFGAYEEMKKITTVGGFRKKRPDDAQELLRAATKEGYIKIA